MLTFRHFCNLQEAKSVEQKQKQILPVMIILKRRAVRVLPDGKELASYYSDEMKKSVMVPSLQ